MKESLKFQRILPKVKYIIPIVLFLILLIISIGWLFTGKAGLSVDSDPALKSSVIQAIVASILLVVTWISIGRADKQIELSNQILELEFQHYLMIEFQLDGKLLFTNISRLPISVSRVIYEIVLMRPIRHEVCKPFVLNAGEAKEIDISVFGLTSQFFNGIIDNEFGIGASVEPGMNSEKLREFLIGTCENMYFEAIYYYAGTGRKEYVKLYELKFEETPWRSDAPSNWWVYLQELQSYGVPLAIE